jgi:MYXO-CTERM domain-containing protein
VAGHAPRALTFTGGTLYYSAQDGSRGWEPYSVSPAFFGDCRPPDLTCPADVEATATASEGAVVHYAPAQATDTASDVTLDYSTPSGATFPPGDTQVRVSASDSAGNTASCSFTVRVGAAPDDGGPTDSGCGCTSGFAADAPWLLLGALAPLMARRRRSS